MDVCRYYRGTGLYFNVAILLVISYFFKLRIKLPPFLLFFLVPSLVYHYDKICILREIKFKLNSIHMKKILLFAAIFFAIFFVNNAKAQTPIIDSVIVTTPILCPGDEATVEVSSSNTFVGSYTLSLFVESGQPFPLPAWNWVGNASIPANQFPIQFGNTINIPAGGLYSGNYMAVVSDPSWSSTSGTYNFTDPLITDTFDFTVYPAVPILIISTLLDTNFCFSNCTASDSINILGGQAPYTITLTQGTNPPGIMDTLGALVADTVYRNLCADTYVVSILDDNGCPKTKTFTIEEPPLLVPGTVTVDDVDSIQCFNETGKIRLSPSGGTLGYAFDWFDVVTGFPAVPSNIIISPPLYEFTFSAGSYYALITDGNGCDTISDIITLLNPDSLGASITYINPTCHDSSNGTITITLSSFFQGAGGPFQYTQNGGAFWSNFPDVDFNGIPDTFVVIQGQDDGTYTNLRVRDINNCEFVLPTVTLTDLDPVTFDLTALDYNGFQISCNGVCDGVVTLNNMQGGAGAPYSIGDSTIFVDTTRDSYCGKTFGELGITYFDTIQDAIGCLGFRNITIFEPEIFSISANTVLLANGYSVSCPGTCDGLITITPNGGAAGNTIDYFVSSSNSSQSNISFVTFNNVCGENTNNGQDTIIAIDANGCIDTTNISLLEPVLFTFDIDSINENCALNNGKAWISNLNGGLPPYTYTWTGPVGTGPFPNDSIIEALSYGQYNITVTDAMGCFFNDSTFVDSSFILVDYNVLVPCNGIDNGEIIINTNGVLLSQIVLEDLTNNNIIVNYNSSYDLLGNLVQNPNIAVIDTFSNLTSGSYELRVELYGNPQGSQGCTSVSYPITIGDSVSMYATLDDTLSFLDLACFGDSTQSIILHVLDGFNLTPNSPNNNQFNAYTVSPLGPQNIAISDSPFGNNNFLQAGGTLFAGNYNIVITPDIDTSYLSNGVIIIEPRFTNCYDTVLVTITEPDSLEFILGSVQTLCYGDSTGIIFVDTIFGGNSGEYNYTWKDASGGTINNQHSIVSDLPAGWYFLTVLDSLSCTPATIDSIEITEPTDITWTAAIAAIDSCEYTSSTGAIVLTSTGGMGLNSYMWNGLDANGNPFTSLTQNLSTLTSGMYYVTITDTNSCTKNDSVFIDNGHNPSLDSSSFTNVSCFGLHDGSYIGIADSINGSLSFPYTFYDFSSNAFVSGYIPSDSLLAAGDIINIRIKDNFGCVDSSLYVITEPDLLQITSLIADTFIGGYNVSCNGILDGAITFDTVVGGTPNYTYWLQDTNSVQNPLSINPLFDTLAATYYKAFVIDANGCLDSLVITLTQPDSLLIDSFDIHTYIGGNNVSCDGFSDGAAQVYASGGNQIYSYIWSSALADSLSLTDTVIDLSAISYTLVVTDPNGCNAIGSINLTEPTPLLINGFNTTNLLCKGGDRGNATVNVSGSIAGYTYLWNNANSTIPTYVNPNDTVPSMNDTTAFADTLRVGWYNVEVWDMNGCYITDSVELTEPIISITIDSLIVTQMTCFSYNNASVDIIATGPQPNPYLYSVYDEFNPQDSVQGNIGFTSGLSSGNYVALVKDDLGCLDRDTFIINPLDSVYIDTVVFNNISCNGFNDGYIQNIVPMGGTAPYEYSINGGNHFSSWLCNTNPNTCPTGYIFSGLAAGIYDVEIWDANGCANSYKITINEPVQMAVSITTNSYNNYQVLCDGDMDSAFVNVSGGLSPYTLDNSISSPIISNSGAFISSGILAGVYNFTITDDNSCTYTETVTFNDPEPITFTSIITDVFCDGLCTGEITAIVAGGVGLGNGLNYTYQWYDGSTTISPLIGQNSYNLDNRCIGIYTIQATDDNGCQEDQTFTIGGNVLQISIANLTINDVSCYEICDGSIDINVSGGVSASSGATYNYLWSDVLGQTANPAIGLCAGSYTCMVWDNATPACTVVTSLPILVSEPNEFIANIILESAILCNGGTGDLSITTTGGITPGASYEWSDGTTTNSLSSVIAGNYTCFVEDSNGCTDTAHYNSS